MKTPLPNNIIQFVFLQQIITGKVISVSGNTVTASFEFAGKEKTMKLNKNSIIKIKK